jgi:hypothetical protein
MLRHEQERERSAPLLTVGCLLTLHEGEGLNNDGAATGSELI